MAKVGLLLALDFGVGLFLARPLSVAGENSSQSHVVDAFKVFEHLPYDAAVREANPDPMFQCLSANRTEFVAEAPSATYVWSLNAGENKPREHTAVLYTAGNAPDKFFTMIASECTLWVTYDMRYSYPEECDKKHTELCGEGVSLFDKELCGDDDAF